MQDQQRRFCQNRFARVDGSSWAVGASGAGRVGRDRVRRDVFRGRCGRKEERI